MDFLRSKPISAMTESLYKGTSKNISTIFKVWLDLRTCGRNLWVYLYNSVNILTKAIHWVHGTLANACRYLFYRCLGPQGRGLRRFMAILPWKFNLTVWYALFDWLSTSSNSSRMKLHFAPIPWVHLGNYIKSGELRLHIPIAAASHILMSQPCSARERLFKNVVTNRHNPQ